MNRNDVIREIEKKVSDKNLIKHMLAAEACMKRLAYRFGLESSDWALAGLAHDIDYDATRDNFARHGLDSAEILKEMGASKQVIDAVKAHAGKKNPDNILEWSLYAADPLTGLIVAAALMHPDRKLKPVNMEFLMNRFSEKRFAAGADRQQIKSCINTGLELEDFIGECLDAMKSIDTELGL